MSAKSSYGAGRGEEEHDFNGAFCSKCGADEAGSFAAGPCEGFVPAVGLGEEEPAAVSGRVEVPVGRLVGETIVSVEGDPEAGDCGWLTLRTSGGLSLYVDAPTLYGDAGATVEPEPARVHLAEMRDLAARIIGMGNTLESRETGRPTVAVWDLGRELAELVNHYEPARDSGDALDALSLARTALDDPAGLPETPGKFLDVGDDETMRAFAIDRIDDAMQTLQGEEA